jgi:hypothetical protein
VDAAFPGDLDRPLIAGVGVAQYAHRGVRRQDPLQLPGSEVRPVGDDDHPGVLAVADADAAAVMDADPGRAGGGVHEGVEERPVGDRVRAIEHRLGLAVR